MEPLNEQLKAARKKAGLTQKRLAELAGISKSAIEKYEYGTKVPTLGTLKRLCEILNTTITID